MLPMGARRGWWVSACKLPWGGLVLLKGAHCVPVGEGETKAGVRNSDRRERMVEPEPAISGRPAWPTGQDGRGDSVPVGSGRCSSCQRGFPPTRRGRPSHGLDHAL